MPVQNCSLLKSIKILSDDLKGGNFFLGSRYAPSICRSIIEENGRDIIWGKAEEEIEMIIRMHAKKMTGKAISIKNVKIFWEWDEIPDEEEEEEPLFRRSDYRAVYLNGIEQDYFREINRDKDGYYGKSCKLDTGNEGGSYLVCRKLPLAEWDRLMVGISIRSLPYTDA